VARALLTRFSRGEHVAIWAANCPEWVLIEFGAALAGITLVTVNPNYLGEELAYVLGQSTASGILVQPDYRGRNLLEIIDRTDLPHVGETISLSGWDDFLASAPADVPLPDVRPDDTAQIQYTSGTTGFPKAALLTHRGLANSAPSDQCDFIWVPHYQAISWPSLCTRCTALVQMGSMFISTTLRDQSRTPCCETWRLARAS
jgi:fatty-acyl-CoA synthase